MLIVTWKKEEGGGMLSFFLAPNTYLFHIISCFLFPVPALLPFFPKKTLESSSRSAAPSGGSSSLAARRHVGVGGGVLRTNLDAVRLNKETRSVQTV